MNNKLCNCGFPQSYPIPHKHSLPDVDNHMTTYTQRSVDHLLKLQNNALIKEIENLIWKNRTLNLRCFHKNDPEWVKFKQKYDYLE